MILEYLLLRTIQKLLSGFSYRSISNVGAWAGRIFYRMRVRRAVAENNLLRSNLGQDVRKVLCASYENLGRTFFELLLLDHIHLTETSDYRLDLPSNFLAATARGAILISAHLGNWELMGKILVARGIPLAVVVRKQKNSYVDRMINDQRQQAGMKIIYDDDPIALRKYMDEKYCLALLADQDFGNNTIPVTFFGRACRAAAGPQFLARKFNLPVFMCFAERVNGHGHRFTVEPFESCGSFTQDYTTAIETAVRRVPEQWFWQHRRWKVHA
jgi:KDO2-lipid IV(A) lauroyltransferase